MGNGCCLPGDRAPLQPLLLLPIPSLSAHPHSSLANCPMGCRSFIAIGLVLAVDEGVSGRSCPVWLSFKIRPFSITISVFIVAHLINLLKLFVLYLPNHG